jgi:hypothetical protein
MVWRYRPDGDLVRNVPHTRRIMPLIMRSRTESVVYFEQKINVDAAFKFLNTFRNKTGHQLTLLHLTVLAATRVLSQRPRLNRFTAGGRLYQRRGVWVSFSAKQAKNDDSPIFLVKREVNPKWSLEELIGQLDSGIQEGRSGKKSATDKELSLLFKLPHFLLSFLVRLIMRADHFGLLPHFFMKSDPLFASLFIANLGSIQMDAGYHHLFEYGNTPIFLTIGEAKKERALLPDGSTTEQRVAQFKYSFDERVEDGLYAAQSLALLKDILENPESHFSDKGESDRP